MRGKRSKQYRKLMQQYHLVFHFREPYQVLIDAQMIQDTHRFCMDLIPSLKRTLHGEVKPLITQCTIRHLYALSTQPISSHNDHILGQTTSAPISSATKTALLSIARTLTLRRCDHHTLPEPLSTLECHQSVLDPRGSGNNIHRYVLAAQNEDLRAWARTSVRAVPSIYVRRSVMIMEPMTDASRVAGDGVERGKLHRGVHKKGRDTAKRKREADDEGSVADMNDGTDIGTAPHNGNKVSLDGSRDESRKKKTRGPKGPNPLSMKKKRPRPDSAVPFVTQTNSRAAATGQPAQGQSRTALNGTGTAGQTSVLESTSGEDMPLKRKRRRRHKGASESAGVAA